VRDAEPRPTNLIARLYRTADRSLRARILLPTALLFAITLTAMVLASAGFYGSDMEQGQHERAEIFARMVAGGVNDLMLEGKALQLPTVMAAVVGHRADISSISVLAPSGHVHSSSRPELVGTRPWGHMIERFSAPVVVDAPGSGSKEYAVVHPLPNSPRCQTCHGPVAKVNGWLDLRFTRRTIDVQKTKLTHTLGLSAAVAFLCLMTIAWWLLGREAIAPLQRLVNSMRRAESGDLGVRADEGRSDELGVAARGFEAMLAALRQSQAELESFYRERMVRADRFAAVGELATGLAHEIKNPLAGLSGALELLAEDLAAQPRQTEVVTEMRHQVDRLTNTMESLLSFARPPKARLRTTDVNETLEKVLFLIRQQRRAASVVVDPQLGKGLPPVLADPNQLEQVLLNICLNASQAMGGDGTLTVRSFEQEGRVTVEIEDTGPGIPVDIRPNIFKPFFTTKREGNGLGLAISARIVAEHGGHIGYRCPPSGGTIFAVTLQRAQSTPAERLPEHAA
jgi:signal transduction histidine kinase